MVDEQFVVVHQQCGMVDEQFVVVPQQWGVVDEQFVVVPQQWGVVDEQFVAVGDTLAVEVQLQWQQLRTMPAMNQKVQRKWVWPCCEAEQG